MNNVPNGWFFEKVENMGRVITGSTPPMSDPENYGGDFCWATAQDFKSKYIKNTVVKLSNKGKGVARVLPAGSVLVTCIASIGLNAIAQTEMATNQQINAIVPNSNFDSEFLYYLFCYNTGKLKQYAGGGGILILSKGEFEKIRFLVPQFLEQKKIAEILGTWDQAIEELSDLITEKKELKRGLMQRLLTGTQRLPGFTKPWKKDFLSNLCDIETGKKDVNEGNPTGQYPFFTCAKTHTFADTFSYDKEAILIAGNGDVGNCQYYNGKFEAYQRTYILSNFRTDVRLLFQILDTKMSRYAESQKQQGAMPYIKLGALTDFIVYMPEDFAEQKAIAEVLTKADAEIDLLNQQLDVLREQKRGLMQKLLTGEIRVKVDNE